MNFKAPLTIELQYSTKDTYIIFSDALGKCNNSYTTFIKVTNKKQSRFIHSPPVRLCFCGHDMTCVDPEDIVNVSYMLVSTLLSHCMPLTFRINQSLVNYSCIVFVSVMHLQTLLAIKNKYLTQVNVPTSHLH